MSTTSTLALRQLQPAILIGTTGAGGKPVQPATAGGVAAAPLPLVEQAVSATVTLSSEALAAGAGVGTGEPGTATLDAAQEFAGNFAASLFSGADGASLAFGSSAHVTGTGKLVTADGHGFAFEADVRYDAAAQAGNNGARAFNRAIDAPDAMALMGKQLPEIKFPGSLSDLFKILDRELQLEAPRDPSRSEAGETGFIALRLVRLVNSAALIAPRARPDDPQATAAERSKALAASYGGAAPATGTPSATGTTLAG